MRNTFQKLSEPVPIKNDHINGGEIMIICIKEMHAQREKVRQEIHAVGQYKRKTNRQRVTGNKNSSPNYVWHWKP